MMLRLVHWLTRAFLPRTRGAGKGRRVSPRRRRPLTVEGLEDRALLSSNVVANFAVSSDWGSGLQAQISLTNTQTTAVPNWNLSFDYAGNITSLWDAHVISHVGNHYQIAGAAWDQTLPGPGSVAFGFIASGASGATPINYLLNGQPLDGNPLVLPSFSIGNATVTPGANGTANATFTVTLSAAASSPVSIQYSTADGTAQAGRDYTAVSGTLTFAAGQTQATLVVPVFGNALATSDLTFYLNLRNPQGGTIGQAQGVGTIKASAPVGGAFQFQVTNDWGSGFGGQITIRNQGTAPLTSWTLEFDSPMQISSIWNAILVSHVGNHYIVKNESWNGAIAVGGSVSFGFNASPGGTPPSPTNFVLHAVSDPTGGGGGGGTTTIQANDDTLWTTPGQGVSFNPLLNDTVPNGDTLTISTFTQGQHGSVTRNADGTLRYVPMAGYLGSDLFTYTASDGHGDTVTATVRVTVAAASTWPTQFYAPYVDMTLYPTFNLATAQSTQGINFFTLAFVVADTAGNPSWGGYSEYDVNGGAFDMQVRSQIATVRGNGGDVMVSFGGASGQELAQVKTDVASLTSAYQAVINAYNLTHLDFDIEGAALADRASVDRRAQAIAALQKAAAAQGKSLEVWFTLPVLPTGLTPDGVYLLQSAQKYGVNIAGVNLMTMDYGDSAAPSPKGQMGTYAIQAARSVFTQLQGLYGTTRTDAQLWHMIGLTPMIGLNDVTTETFDQAAAQQVLLFAQQQGLGRLSIWSLNRDRQNANGAIGYVDTQSSSILQQPFEFSHLFELVNG